MNTRLLKPLAATATVLALAACSQDESRMSEATQSTQDVNPVRAEQWIDQVKLSDTTAVGQEKSDFAAGEPIELSMMVDQEAPAGTTVTAYWYGPGNVALSYESKDIPAGGQELNFVQDNTYDWQQGSYRAEVWVGDEKVEEESFQIVSG